MQTIPAGSFAMGSEDREYSQPIHQVNIAEFSMGKYEVTVKEFRQFVEATNYSVPQECRHELNVWFLRASPGNWQANALNTSEFQPVVCINWQAANAYAEWLAKETGKPYRLPTEAEWEYAARAGTTSRYYFGEDTNNTKVCEYENVGDLSGENILQRNNNTSYFNWSGDIASCADHAGYASIVGMYKPNPFGLHDMLSNVLEMLQDCYVGDYKDAPNDGSARISESCENRVTRGGSWHWSHYPLVRRGNIPEDFSGGVDGFRLAMDGATNNQTKATKTFAKALLLAQQQEQKRRDIQPDIPQPVNNLQITMKNQMVHLTWDKSTEQGVDSYRIYRNDVPGQMFKLVATNVRDNSFIDANFASHQYDYTVVAVRKHVQSLYATPVTKPAGWIAIPSQVEAEWAKSYEGSSITFTSDESPYRLGFNLTGVGGIGDDAELTYQVVVPEKGKYKFSYRVASPRDTKGFELYSNDKKLAQYTIAKTGGLSRMANAKWPGDNP